jgi:hypothetical protein
LQDSIVDVILGNILYTTELSWGDKAQQEKTMRRLCSTFAAVMFTFLLLPRLAAEDELKVCVYGDYSFLNSGVAYSNVVMFSDTGSTPKTLDEALGLTDSHKFTLVSEDGYLLRKGSVLSGVVSGAYKQLVLQETDSKGKTKKHKFKFFDTKWTTPDQIR